MCSTSEKDRPKLGIADQIKKLDSRGVKFKFMSKEQAKEALLSINNYFKLTAYRKSFEVNADGKYVDLDFAYLKDLSKIDMYLRYCLLEMCLDIEHFGKAKFMGYLTNQPEEDGYSIIPEHIASREPIEGSKEPNYLKISYEDAYRKAAENEYCRDLYTKHMGDMPVWAAIEIMSFGTFVDLYMFFGKKYKYKNMIDQAHMMISISRLRNACAHNNCIINDLSRQQAPGINNKLNMNLNRILTISERDLLLNNPRTAQITTLLYLHQELVKTGLHDYQKARLNHVIGRMYANPIYYKNNVPIQNFFSSIKKLVDNWF
jgi:abortive infection bacteriophage resistance protein